MYPQTSVSSKPPFATRSWLQESRVRLQEQCRLQPERTFFVSSQADTEKAVLGREPKEVATDTLAEHEELTSST
jgi:hypothetical protein